MHKNTATAAIIQLVWLSVRLPPPEISPFQTEYRLNLACLAVGSTLNPTKSGTKYSGRLNLACLAVGSTTDDMKKAIREIRLNLACLAVGSTGSVDSALELIRPPQSSLFGCRFDC